MLIRMAWRNLWRNKRRTLITGFSVGFGVLLATTFTAWADYAYTEMIDASARMGYGHVSVMPAGYNATPTLKKRIDGAREIRRKALSIPGVEGAMTRITGQAMFASAAKSVGGVFVAVDPAQEDPEMNLFIRSLVRGALFEGTEGREILVGTKMAEKLNLDIGKKIVYTATDVSGEIVSEVAYVSGIFETGVDSVDGAFALLPIDRARSMLRYGPEEATMVSVIIDDQRYAGIVADKLREKAGGPGREMLTWRDTQADLAAFIAIDKSSNRLFQFLVGLMIAAGILNTIMMAVLERKREFGVMLAVGMSPSRLFALVLTESFWIGMLGIILGVVITAPWYTYVSVYGIDLGAVWKEDIDIGGVLFDPLMRFRLYKESVIAILSTVFGLTLAAGLYPAWKAGRVPPVESLKTI